MKSTEVVSSRTDFVLSPAPAVLPVTLFSPTPKAAQRALGYFTTQINNDHTGNPNYLNATRRFAEWCELHRLHQLVCTTLPRRRLREGSARPFPPSYG
jgi:hypothetical protein